MRSVTKVRFIAVVSVEVTQEVHYKDGVLIWSEARKSLINREHDYVSLKRLGNSYQLSHGSKKEMIHDEVRDSMASFMFDEPLNLGRVFSEVEGEFHRVEKKSPRNYIKTNS